MKTIIACMLMLTSGTYATARAVRLTHDNTVVFSSRVDINSIDLLLYAILAKREHLAASETLHILLASGGGDAKQAVFFNKIAALLPNTDIICGWCASSAGAMFEGAGLKRLAFLNSVMLMHEVREDGITAAILEKNPTLDSLKRESDAFNKIIYDRIGLTKHEYELKIVGTEWIVKGKDLIKLKLADEFVTIECDRRLQNQLPLACK